MKFINSSSELNDVDQIDTFETEFNKLGRPSKDEPVFAKMISSKSQSKYAILVYKNQPYDPYGVDSHREANLDTQLKQVSKETFSNYISYLKTKNSLYMTRSQRSFING